MKFCLIKKITLMTFAISASMAIIPASFVITNSISNATVQQSNSNKANTAKYSDNVQVVNSVNDIIVEQAAIQGGAVSSAIVNVNNKQEIYVWGKNSIGQLGLGDTLDRLTPTLLSSEYLGNYLSITQLNMSGNSCFAIVETTHGQQIYVWGFNTSGQLGIGHFANQSRPVLFDTKYFGNYTVIDKISFDSDILYSQNSYAIVYTATGAKKCFMWGNNDNYALGINRTGNIHTPMPFNTTQLSEFITIKDFVIADSSYIITSTKTGDEIYVWGNNNYGQLGLKDKVNRQIPTRFSPTFLTPGITIKSFKMQWNSTSIVISKVGIDSVYVWGRNDYGQLGINNTTSITAPQMISQSVFNNAPEIVNLSIGYKSHAIVKKDGVESVYVWGYNTSGQLGVNSTSGIYSPTYFNPAWIGNYTEIYDSSWHSSHHNANGYAYVKTPLGDQLYVWGDNSYGQLGDGTNTNRPSPSRVTTFDLNHAKIIHFTKFHYFTNFYVTLQDSDGIRSYAAGDNSFGQLGINNTTNQNRFIEILPRRQSSLTPIQKRNELSANDAIDSFSSNNVINKNEFKKFVNVNSFPDDAVLTIDNKTNVDYQNGIINLVVNTNKYYALLTNDIQYVTGSFPKSYALTINDFLPAKDFAKNPIKAKPLFSGTNNELDLLLKSLINESNIVIDRIKLAQYFDLSSIPMSATISLKWDISNMQQFVLDFSSDQVYDNGGRVTKFYGDNYYTQQLVFITPSNMDPTLVTTLILVGGGVLLITCIIIWGLWYRWKRKMQIYKNCELDSDSIATI